MSSNGIQQRPPHNPHARPEPVQLQAWNARKGQIMVRMPSWLRPEKFEATVRTAFYEGGDMLARISPESFLYAVTSCAELGLTLGKTSGHAYLVPFKGDCNLIVGYKGLIFLASRSGIISGADCYAVYKGQAFEYWMENNEWRNKHVPSGEVSTRDQDITHVYCIVTLKDGTKKFGVMTRDQVEEIRVKAPSANSPAWRNHWGEMAKKTVLRRTMKTVPMDPDCEMQKALKLDEPNYEPPPKKDYMQMMAEASQKEIQRLEANEVEKNREILDKYMQIAAKRNIDLGITPEEISRLTGEKLTLFLAKVEEILKE